MVQGNIKTVRTEGVLALYKGYMPKWLQLGPWNIMTFGQLKRAFRIKKQKPLPLTFFLYIF